jgi:hypothetical protein
VIVEFINNKFTSDSNVQEPYLTMMTLDSTLSEKNKNLEVTSLSESKKVKDLERKNT